MRRRAQLILARCFKLLQPKVDQSATIKALSAELSEGYRREQMLRADYVERATELIEARQMSGSGPWLVHESRGQVNQAGKFKESSPITSTGAFGELDLMLSNLEWRREVNLTQLEFSRWGIQQIILISRLYYIKNPIVRRLIDVCAAYVFARGVEVTSEDEAAGEVIEDFFKRNQKTLGHIALVDLERRKDYDGNLFFCFFADKEDKGLVDVRTIDATEIMDIVCDPNDSDTPWLYRRNWTERIFDEKTAATRTEQREAWYPALDYKPASKPGTINSVPVNWNNPIHHRKCGGVAKWHFGCPRVYPMLDWAKQSKKFLEACATVKQALAQIAMTLTTKGGQQALAGAKQQLETTVGTGSGIWDTNPTAVSGSIFASGPGTKLEAFNTKGGGGDPEEVRQFKLMCCMVKGVPETFLADVSTGNLATATSLDRPTETAFMELQEAWIEDLTIIAVYVLKVSAGAPSGKLREAYRGNVTIREAHRKRMPDGRMGYEAKKPEAGTIEVKVNFPAIREGEIPALIASTVAAMGAGIDQKVGVTQLYDLLPGVENGAEIAEEQFPGTVAERQKAKDEAAAQIDTQTPVKPTEAVKLARRLVAAVVEERNGSAQHHR